MKKKPPSYYPAPQSAQQEQNEILETAALAKELEMQNLDNENHKAEKNTSGGPPSITTSERNGNHLKRDQNG